MDARRKKLYGYLRSCVLYRKLLARYGPAKLADKLAHRVRHAFTFVGSQINPHYAEYSDMVPVSQARQTLKLFFADVSWWIMCDRVAEGTRRFHHLISFMQRRMKEKIQTLDSKVEMARYAWDYWAFIWLQRATKHRDEGMK